MIQINRAAMSGGAGSAGLVQARLGAKAQVGEGTVRDFEKSKRIPAGDLLVAMRSALDWRELHF